MNILNKLSIKDLKLNKKRTIGTIIGIILSVALICAVSTMVTSFQKTLVQNAINETGYYHIKISDIPQDKIKEIQSNRDIKEIYETKEIGYGRLDESKNKDKPYIHLHSMNKETFENLKFDLIKGEFPKNENEIIISKHIITNGKSNIKIGDTITLDVGKRVSLDNFELNEANPYNSEDEKIEDATKHTFKVVGIIERPNSTFEFYSDPGYTVITTNMKKEKADVYAVLKEPKKFKTSIPALLGANNYEDIEYPNSDANLRFENWGINNELLRWEAFKFSDSTISMLYAIVSVVLFIIIFTSVFCIRNSFAISITEKMKMYGMLASVGATKKQIKKSVIFEGLILGIVAIPMGILCGLLAVFILIKIVNILLGDFMLNHIDGIMFSVSIIPILVSILLGFITIYFSAISSAKKASRVSPIENLRNNNEIKLNSKKLKTPKFISKTFKTGGTLAYKNLKRSKKKYRTTVISLTVSIFVFISMYAFINEGFKKALDYYTIFDYNVRVYAGIAEYNEQQITTLRNLDNINKSYLAYTTSSNIKVENGKMVNKFEDDEIQCYSYDEKGKCIEEWFPYISIIALDNETFKNYVNKINGNYEYLKDKGILADNYKYYSVTKKKEVIERRYKYKEKDVINSHLTDGKTKFSVEIGKVTDIKPYGYENTYFNGGYIILNKDYFSNLELKPELLLIDSSNSEQLVKDISSIDSELNIHNIDEQAKQEKAMTTVISIFLYGFITVITLIGVTNIFNTITSNMELRSKEFAMLKSVGMTKKEFNRMVNLETVFYSTKSLIYGIILGIIGSIAIYIAFNKNVETAYQFPITAIIICIIFVFIIVYIIMKYSINKINKQNTIETIRKDNI